jgi:hypothetical protein
MKTIVKVEKEIDVKYVRLDIPVRYGEEDIPNDFPLRQGDMWKGIIDVDNGSIIGWTKGKKGEMYMKICDQGTYELLDKDMNYVAILENEYVPNNLLPGDEGDYIDLKIDSTGTIYNWYSSPNFKDFFSDCHITG